MKHVKKTMAVVAALVFGGLCWWGVSSSPAKTEQKAATPVQVEVAAAKDKAKPKSTVQKLKISRAELLKKLKEKKIANSSSNTSEKTIFDGKTRQEQKPLPASGKDAADVTDAPRCSRYPNAPVLAYRTSVLPPKTKGGPAGELREWLVKTSPNRRPFHVDEEWFPGADGKMAKASSVEYAASVVVVKVAGGCSNEEFAKLIKPFGAEVENVLMEVGEGARLVSVRAPDVTLDSIRNLTANLGDVKEAICIEKDFVKHLDSIPNDTYWSDLWGMTKIQTPEAWDAWSTSASSVIVGILDSGVNYNHEDLAFNMWKNTKQGSVAGFTGDLHGASCVDGVKSGDPMDDDGHGTHIAGTIGAVGNNGKGVTGVAHYVKLMALKFGFTMSDEVAMLDYADKMGCKIINCSFGSTSYQKLEEEAFYKLTTNGVIFVCAAGNEGKDNDILPQYPANFQYRQVISVAASTKDDTLANFSCYGLNTVDIAAPGVGILSASYDDDRGVCYMNGTSMAAPHVAGALALLKARYSTASATTLIDRLYERADRVDALKGKVATGARLNVANAISETYLPAPQIAASAGTSTNTVHIIHSNVIGANAYRFYRATSATGTPTPITEWTYKNPRELYETSIESDSTAKVGGKYWYYVRSGYVTTGNATLSTGDTVKSVDRMSALSASATGWIAATGTKPDEWDPADDAFGGGTILEPTFAPQTHGPHGLNSLVFGLGDTRDCFQLNLQAGKRYLFSVESLNDNPVIGMSEGSYTLSIYSPTNTSRALGSSTTSTMSLVASTGLFYLTVEKSSFHKGYMDFLGYLDRYMLHYRIVGADDWDSTDDTMSGATTLYPSYTSVKTHGPHTLDNDDVVDWFKISMSKSYNYFFETTGDGDTYGGLWDANGTCVAKDDDGGANGNFRIVYTPDENGVHYLAVHRKNALFDVSNVTKRVAYSLKYHRSTSSLRDFVFGTGDGWYDEGVLLADSEDGRSCQTEFSASSPIHVRYAYGGGFYFSSGIHTNTLVIRNAGGTSVYTRQSIQEPRRLGEDPDGGVNWMNADSFTIPAGTLSAGSYTATVTLDTHLDNVNPKDNSMSRSFTVDSGLTVVTFNANGGTIAENGEKVSSVVRTVSVGSAFGTLPIPTRVAYTFDGWYTTASGGSQITTTTAPSGKATYYAHWTKAAAQTATVTFNANGGTVFPTTMKFTVGDTLSGLPKASRDGYGFAGWYPSAMGGKPVTTSTVVSGDVTYYAFWVDPCDLTFYDSPSGWSDSMILTDTSNGTADKNQFSTTNTLYVRYAYYDKLGGNLEPHYDYLVVYDTETNEKVYGDYSERGYLQSGYLAEGIFEIPLKQFSPGNYEVDILMDCSDVLPDVDLDNNLQWKSFTVSGTSASTMATVTFNANGGTLASSSATRSVTVGSAIGSLPSPTRSGYTFAGWWTSASGGTKISTTTVVSASVTYYARWTSANDLCFNIPSNWSDGVMLTTSSTGLTEKVSFSTADSIYVRYSYKDVNGRAVGIHTNSILVLTEGYEVVYEDSRLGSTGTYASASRYFTIPRNTLVPGKYAVCIWLDSYGQVDTSNAADNQMMKELTVTASMATVKFNANGGTLAANATNRTIVVGSKLGTLPSNPSRSGYTFAGWYTSASGGTSVTANTTVSASVTYYAHWTQNVQYATVKFNANGGTLAANATNRTIVVGSKLGTLPSNPSRSGYTFAGWYTSASGGTSVTANTTVSASVTYYAHWTQNVQYATVKFNANGGTLTANATNRTIVVGSKLGTLPSNPSRSGYTFAGWYTSASGGTSVTANTTVSANVTYYAHWTQNVQYATVKFNANGGTLAANATNRTIVVGSKLGTLPSNPSRSGYTFAGWYTAASGGTSVTANTTVSASVTYYAHWTQNVQTVTVTFDANGGWISRSTITQMVITQAVNSVVTNLPIPRYSGRSFWGWYTEKDFSSGTVVTGSTVVKSNVTWYAHWTPHDLSAAEEPVLVFTAKPSRGWKAALSQYSDGSLPTSELTTSRGGYVCYGYKEANSHAYSGLTNAVIWLKRSRWNSNDWDDFDAIRVDYETVSGSEYTLATYGSFFYRFEQPGEYRCLLLLGVTKEISSTSNVWEDVLLQHFNAVMHKCTSAWLYAARFFDFTVSGAISRDSVDPKDDTAKGAVNWALKDKRTSFDRTLGKADPEDNFKITGKDGLLYDFAIEKSNWNVVFSITNANGKAVVDVDGNTITNTRSARRVLLPKTAKPYYLTVKHGGEEKRSGHYTIAGQYADVGSIKFAKTAVSVKESAAYVELTVNRTGKNGRVRVKYATAANTAQPGEDYVPQSGVLEWADGDKAAKKIRVTLIPDLVAKYDGVKSKSFNVALTPFPASEQDEDEYPAVIAGGDTCVVTINETSKPGTTVESVYAKQAAKRATVKTEVVPLESGTFYGLLVSTNAVNEQSEIGSLTFTASSAAVPALSAKATIAGKTYSFKGKGWGKVREEASTWFAGTKLQWFESVGKIGRTTCTNKLSVIVAEGDASGQDDWCGWEAESMQRAWLDLNVMDEYGDIKAVRYHCLCFYRNNAKIQSYLDVAQKFAGYYTVSLQPRGCVGNGYLTLTIDNKGNAKVAGMLPDGVTKPSVSVKSCGIVPDSVSANGWAMYVPVFMGKATSCFGGTLRLIAERDEDALNGTGVKIVVDEKWDDSVYRNAELIWNNTVDSLGYCDGDADGVGFTERLTPYGGWYDKVVNLQAYYLNYAMSIETEYAGNFPAQDLPDGYEIVTAVDPRGFALAFENDKIVHDKKKIVKTNRLTDFDLSVNPCNVSVKFTRATGIFTGGCSIWSENGDDSKQKEITGFKAYGVFLLNRMDDSFLDDALLAPGFITKKYRITGYDDWTGRKTTHNWSFSAPFNVWGEEIDWDWSE